jgi:hypothetical protein
VVKREEFDFIPVKKDDAAPQVDAAPVAGVSPDDTEGEVGDSLLQSEGGQGGALVSTKSSDIVPLVQSAPPKSALGRFAYDARSVKFWEASRRGKLEEMRKYYRKGVNVNYAYRKRTPLYELVRDASFPGVKMLIEEMGADVNIQGYNGHTVLHTAISRGHVESDLMALYLIGVGVDLKLVNDSGRNALIYAVEQKRANVVRDLVDAYLEQGISLHERDSHGLTVFDYARASDCSPYIWELLKDGAARSGEPYEDEVKNVPEAPLAPLTAAPVTEGDQHQIEGKILTGWYYEDGDDHVVYTKFFEPLKYGLRYSFNFAGGMVAVSQLDMAGQPAGNVSLVPFPDFADDANCYEPQYLETARQYYQGTVKPS